MNWFTGFVVYFLVWWTALFCVLPIGVRTEDNPRLVASGWRGAPRAANLGWKMLATTLLSAVIWGGIWLLVRSDWLSFRTGWLALPEN